MGRLRGRHGQGLELAAALGERRRPLPSADVDQWISGDLFDGALVQGKATIGWEKTPLGVRYNLIKDLPNGNRLVRHAECIMPNMFIIPSIREPGTKPKRRERGTELSWALPIGNEHVRGMSIVAWPLENGEPKPN